MDRIDIPGNDYYNPALYSGSRAETRKTKRGTKSAFSRLLEGREAREAEEVDALATPSEAELQELLDDVHSAGDALRLRPLTEEIRRYKQAVRQFLRHVVTNSFTVRARVYHIKDDEHRKVQIEVVDQKLEQLASGILSGQISQIDILARLDEITGLLVDLLQ